MTRSVFPQQPGSGRVQFEPWGQSGERQDDRIMTWEKAQEVRPGKVTLWDHCFELPGQHLEATQEVQRDLQVGTVAHKLRAGHDDHLEIYDSPGEYAQRFDGVAPAGQDRPGDLQKILADRRRTASIRAQEQAASAITIRGTGHCRSLASGHGFVLERHHNADGPYVVTGVTHEAHQSADYRSDGAPGPDYGNSFTCIPAGLAYRPARSTPKPVVHGTQTATVVGPAGEEIFTDKYGRVKVQFHWDREGKNDSNSSCWIRVAQFAAGGGWGMISIPRIGQEVVVALEEGDPDRPIIVGCVYNPDQMPPFALPVKKMISGFRSNSYPGGGGNNEISVDDSKGKERMFLNAQYNQDSVVGNNRTAKVAVDSTEDVGNDVAETVGNDKAVFIASNVTKTVGVNKTEQVGANKSINVAANHSETIGSNMSLSVGSNKTETVSMASAESGRHGQGPLGGGRLRHHGRRGDEHRRRPLLDGAGRRLQVGDRRRQARAEVRRRPDRDGERRQGHHRGDRVPLLGLRRREDQRRRHRLELIPWSPIGPIPPRNRERRGSTMLFRNFTPFPPLQFESRDEKRRDFGVVVLRGTFRIEPGKPLRLEQAQEPLVMADEYHGEPGRSSLKRESNLAPYKPRTDVHVTADAYAPTGRPAPLWLVSVEVGEIKKELLVTGDRAWRFSALRGWRLTEPNLVARVPLIYELAYGGPSGDGPEDEPFAANPVGVGHRRPTPADVGRALPAPQVLTVEASLPRLGEPTTCEGFGPTAPSWQPRLGKAGTFNVVWEKTRWPDLPEDFQFAFYNSAHPDLVYPRFVRGDEPVTLTHLAPGPPITFSLPGFELALLLRFQDGQLVPAPVALDTIHIDMHERKVFLNWRGIFPLAKPIRVLEVRMRAPADRAAAPASPVAARIERPEAPAPQPAARRHPITRYTWDS